MDRNLTDQLLSSLTYKHKYTLNPILKHDTIINKDVLPHYMVNKITFESSQHVDRWLTMNTGITTKKMLKRIFEVFLGNTDALSSSIVRSKYEKYVTDAKKAINEEIKLKIDDGTFETELKRAQTDLLLAHEKSLINRVCFNLRYELDQLQYIINENTFYKDVDDECEESLFSLLITAYTEEEIAERVKIATIGNVLNL